MTYTTDPFGTPATVHDNGNLKANVELVTLANVNLLFTYDSYLPPAVAAKATSGTYGTVRLALANAEGREEVISTALFPVVLK